MTAARCRWHQPSVLPRVTAPAPDPVAHNASPSSARPSSASAARDWLRRRLAPAAIRTLRGLGLTVSRDDVLWCFRHLLGREPESEQVVLAHSRFLRFRSLAAHIVASPEYAGRRASAVATPPAYERPGAISHSAFSAEVEDFLAAHPATPGLRAYAEMHRARLLDTLNTVRRVLPDGGQLLDYSAVGFFSHALDRLLPDVRQVNVSGVNYELDDYAERFGIAGHDMCLNTEVIEHLIFDPSRMVHQINRMLRPGGHLLLTTPNAIAAGNGVRLLTGNAPSVWNQLNAASPNYFDRHNRDWTPFEVTRLLEEHGFEVLELSTRDYYQDSRRLLAQYPALHHLVRQHSSHGLHGDTQLVLAQKRRESAAPVRNAWLYLQPAAS